MVAGARPDGQDRMVGFWIGGGTLSFLPFPRILDDLVRTLVYSSTSIYDHMYVRSFEPVQLIVSARAGVNFLFVAKLVETFSRPCRGANDAQADAPRDSCCDS